MRMLSEIEREIGKLEESYAASNMEHKGVSDRRQRLSLDLIDIDERLGALRDELKDCTEPTKTPFMYVGQPVTVCGRAKAYRESLTHYCYGAGGKVGVYSSESLVTDESRASSINWLENKGVDPEIECKDNQVLLVGYSDGSIRTSIEGSFAWFWGPDDSGIDGDHDGIASYALITSPELIKP